MFVPLSCCDKEPQTEWLKTGEVYSSCSSRGEVPNQGVSRACSLGSLQGRVLPCLLHLLTFPGNSWGPVACSSLTPLTHATLSRICLHGGHLPPLPSSQQSYWIWAFPAGSAGEEPACQCSRHRRPGFSPWVGKIPWRRRWQPAPVFLSGKFHGKRSLVGSTAFLHCCRILTNDIFRDVNKHCVRHSL